MGYFEDLKEIKKRQKQKKKEMRNPENRRGVEIHLQLIDYELSLPLHRKQPDWELKVNNMARKGLPSSAIFEEMKNET